MVETEKNYLDPAVLNKVNKLEMRARLVVEGFISGMHKSPYRGYSVEFAQHREYVAGDDVRHIDWKIYGKSDRLHIKEYEEETNLRAFLFVDQSESMSYAYDGGMSKFDYASSAAAALAFMMQQQSDAIGLHLFDDKLVNSVPPSNTRGNLSNIIHNLEQAKPTQKTKIGAVLQELAGHMPKRGLVLLFSDLFDDADHVLRGLRALGQRGHDIIVFHVLDRDEVEFPFERMTMFEGMEEMPELLADPRSLRDAYLAEVAEFRDTIRRGCLGQKIDYVKLVNNQPLDVVLSSYLAARAARAKRFK
ncbi:MAG: DUF58 domain-containing protein [Planctomycetota bacterium]|jgi:uncharacterized protein (DUF58 family)